MEPIAPACGSPTEALVSVREQGRLGKSPFQFAKDDLRVAIDVGADLHHRRAPIFRGLGSQKVSPRRTAYNGRSSRRKRQSRYRCMLSNTVRAWIRSTVLWPLVNQP
jgi:hypothetical protein